VPVESSCSGLSFLGRQQPCRHNCTTKAFEGQSKEIEPRRCRVDQPCSPLTADERQTLQRRVAPARETLGEAEAAAAWRDGQGAPMEEVLRTLGGGVAL